MTGFQAFLSFTLPVLVAVLGWIIVHAQQIQLDNRRDKRFLIDQLEKDIRELTLNALKYHTGDERNIRNEGVLKFDLERISVSIEFLSDSGGDQSIDLDLIDRLITLRQAITFRNFETVTWKSLATRDLDEISAASGSLLLALESIRARDCMLKPVILIWYEKAISKIR